MALLHNRVSQKELKERLYQESDPRVTLSFYRYFKIDDPKQFRDLLYKQLNELKVFGRIYIAHEGVNAQLSVPETNFESLKNYLNTIEPLMGIRFNVAVDDVGKSFWVLKVKVREMIVSDGITDTEFDMQKKGKYVDAEDFNKLTEDPATIIVDMRNHYEYEVGHFINAVEVPSDTFREQLPMVVKLMAEQKDKNIIMYCTGGIRCEKASAFMLHNGFKNVYHLEGGIIHYANTVKEKELINKFIGKNFVFDDRLGEKIGEEVIAKCHQCGQPSDIHVNCVNEGCHLLFIQCNECSKKFEGCCSKQCVDIIHLDEDERKKLRTGHDKGRNIFNKSRVRLQSEFGKHDVDSL